MHTLLAGKSAKFKYVCIYCLKLLGRKLWAMLPLDPVLSLKSARFLHVQRCSSLCASLCLQHLCIEIMHGNFQASGNFWADDEYRQWERKCRAFQLRLPDSCGRSGWDKEQWLATAAAASHLWSGDAGARGKRQLALQPFSRCPKRMLGLHLSLRSMYETMLF